MFATHYRGYNSYCDEIVHVTAGASSLAACLSLSSFAHTTGGFQLMYYVVGGGKLKL